MHSWVFRNRRLLERLYGLAPAREETTRRTAAAPRPAERTPALSSRLLIPQPRRAAKLI